MLLADLKKVEGSLSSDATLSFIKDLSEMQRLTEFCINDCTSSSQIRLSNNLENLHDLLPKAPNLQEFCISRLTENQSYDLTCNLIVAVMSQRKNVTIKLRKWSTEKLYIQSQINDDYTQNNRNLCITIRGLENFNCIRAFVTKKKGWRCF